LLLGQLEILGGQVNRSRPPSIAPRVIQAQQLDAKRSAAMKITCGFGVHVILHRFEYRLMVLLWKQIQNGTPHESCNAVLPTGF
jgi:hypothetical protein